MTIPLWSPVGGDAGDHKGLPLRKTDLCKARKGPPQAGEGKPRPYERERRLRK
ncbi:MAG TPA: hypothetical protein VEV19_11010 [Ktedonobacteraceae bacterium]|nr:hypothetical protein [Ktedonobacteraceae bacterium]